MATLEINTDNIKIINQLVKLISDKFSLDTKILDTKNKKIWKWAKFTNKMTNLWNSELTQAIDINRKNFRNDFEFKNL